MTAYQRIKDPRTRAYVRWIVSELAEATVEQE